MQSISESRASYGKLTVDNKLDKFVKQFLSSDNFLPNVSVFWKKIQTILEKTSGGIESSLKKRQELQAQIDQWHQQFPGTPDPDRYYEFLKRIGYLEELVNDFQVKTDPNTMDPEITSVPGPQLVVPVDNARYALNAVNARWGSLYDAMYGTDVITSTDALSKENNQFNPARALKVIDDVFDMMDEFFPLENDLSHRRVIFYENQTHDETNSSKMFLKITMSDGTVTQLKHPEKYLGYQRATELTNTKAAKYAIILQHHGIKFKLIISDYFHRIARLNLSHISDVQVEGALTTIMDFEDSVASTNCSDKVKCYSNWLGLMKGDLTSSFQKNNKTVNRQLNSPESYFNSDDQVLKLPNRSIILVRNVGSHLKTNAVKYEDQPIPETILDAVLIGLIGYLYCRNNGNGNSVYMVKPKMHGSSEVRQADELFSLVESEFYLPKNVLKMGIMDEERRTSLNLKNCLWEARERVFFINTGFLDRTGDEIRTSTFAGPFLPKSGIKKSSWLSTYEHNNVATGMNTGLLQRAQIGKGMWARPDHMREMLETKIQHLMAGATTAWVPSPTAAVLHTIHYLSFNVIENQEKISHKIHSEDLETFRRGMLQLSIFDPKYKDQMLSNDQIETEVKNHLQGILGYVTRWVDQGVGCSKVPNLNGVGLMEDCATLRIASQHLANWLQHNIVTCDQIERWMLEMAKVVDHQNRDDSNYRPMSDNFRDSESFQTAHRLIFKGIEQPNGYTEFNLYQGREQSRSK